MRLINSTSHVFEAGKCRYRVDVDHYKTFYRVFFLTSHGWVSDEVYKTDNLSLRAAVRNAYINLLINQKL